MTSYAPYSFSKVATHVKCPAKFNYAYVQNLKGTKVPSPQMDRGIDIHKSVETYVLGGSEMLHPDIHQNYGQWLMGIRANYLCFPEQKFALKRDWTVCTYDDPDTWIRGYLDLKILPKEGNQGELVVYEWKTGNIYEEDHQLQRLFYGCVALSQHPEHEQARVITTYLDKRDVREDNWPRSDIEVMRAKVLERIDAIENDKYWITKPTYGCRYCNFSRSNGGPCPF